ncbi:H-NS family nucleoid-associated regulatory protein, partial [Klebsiella pneumoniae]|uniref:H-NS family nucleoid-associated regulatory protein n=1 Tax=Klebsiella pneumoniae TaxID=573 RepID=UPI003B592FCB
RGAYRYCRKAKQARKTKEPRPYKYQFDDENGNMKKWTGQGRTPKALQKALESGKSLDDF